MSYTRIDRLLSLKHHGLTTRFKHQLDYRNVTTLHFLRPKNQNTDSSPTLQTEKALTATYLLITY